MYKQAKKPQENKTTAVANSVAQKKNSGKQGFGFVDNRPVIAVQNGLSTAQCVDKKTNVDKKIKQGSMNSGLVLQAQWVYVDVDGGKRLNLSKTEDSTVFILKSDSSKYKVIGTAGDGEPIVIKIGGAYENWRSDNFSEYQNWTKGTNGVSITPPFGNGQVSAYHNRGAPKISSRQDDFGGAKLGDSYVEYKRGLQSGGMTDAQIAQALLDLNDSALVSDLEKRAASMMHVTVYLAEEWRKQGAAKIYRSILRSIIKGERDFSTFENDFAFIPSAEEGREQVARLMDVQRGDKPQKALTKSEQQIFGNMSPPRTEDFDTDDDMKDEKSLKKTRDFSNQNKGASGWHSPWK
ncbi:hypothetical protein [Pectobacterium polaris]|uniref:Uncharacterized protein n=1 Tax=Pectobacterium polaris TaxID=2042057 RepID=A0AAW5GBD0_9GAMM|nr:hypothetical protein [Pectobacterium polaris]MCL6350646.1 hypothetical protein [Pectobacterium polaris]MCL6368044.1 hypothetical protein [Pectobacterium polaris]